MRSRQRGALILLGLLSVALVSAVVLTPARRPAVALAATNACKSNATGTFSDISVGLTGTPTPSAATAGNGTLTLGGVSFTAAVPATLLISGYNLGLLTVGANSIPVKGWVAIAATNTTEGVKSVQFTTSVSTTVADPDTVPGTGDETATPLSLNLGLGDTTWSPTGAGAVSFSQGPPGSLPTIPAGQVAAGATTPVGGIYISAQVAGGLIKANFDCQGGTSAVGGATFTAATPGPFATASLSVPGTTVPPGTTAAPTTAPGTTAPGTTAPGTTAPGTTAAPTTAPGTTAPATTAPATTAPSTTLPPVAGSRTYSTSCKNSITPDVSNLGFDVTGSAPTQVQADSTFALTKLKWKVTVPASVFQTGINLGLLTGGTSVAATLDVSVKGTNTTLGAQSSAKISLTVPVATGADGLALPSTVAFDVPDMQWTAMSGKIDFSLNGANVSVKIGLPNPVSFSCSPVELLPFVTTNVVGSSTATTTTSTAPASTTTVRASTTTTAAVTTTTIPGPATGSASYTTSCKNNVTKDESQLVFDASGTVPGQVTADNAFVLSKMKWKVTIPASVFQTGINLGLVTPGTPISGTIDLAITATNTVQTTQDALKIALTVPVATGADGLALPSTVSFDVPDQTWTARSGKIDMAMYGANVSVKLGLPTAVVFVCTPSARSPFVSTNAVGVSTATTTTLVSSAAVAPTTTVAQSLVVTGPSGSLVVQILMGLVLLDLGYLTLSLRRSPRRVVHRR